MNTQFKELSQEVVLDPGSRPAPSLHENNRAQLAGVSLVSFLPSVLFQEFKQIGYLWGLIVCVAAVAAATGPHCYIEPTAFSLLLFVVLLKRFLSLRPLMEIDRQLAQLTYTCWTSESSDSLKSGELVPGHLLLLKSGEISPAEMLFLATGDPKAEAFVAESEGLLRREAVLKTHECFHKGEFTKLKGTAYVRRSAGLVGKLLLDQDYRHQPLSPKNFIPKGVTVRGCESLLGLVVCVGNDTEFNQVMRRHKTVRSLFDSALDLLVWSFIGCVSAIFLLFLIKDLHNTPDHFEGLYYLQTMNELVAPLSPVPLLIVIELARLAQSVILFRRAKVCFASTEHTEQVGYVRQAAISSRALLARTQAKVVTELDYDSYTYYRPKPMRAFEPSQLFHSRQGVYALQRSRSLRERLTFSDIPEKWRLGKYIALAAVFTQQDDELLTDDPVEVSAVRLSEALGCVIKLRTDSECKLEYNHRQHSFKVLATQQYSPETEVSVVVVSNESGLCQLFVKGAPRVVKTMLSPGQINTTHSCERVIIAVKELSASQIVQFTAAYSSAQFLKSNAQQTLSAVFKPFLNNLDYVTSLRFRPSVPPETQTAMKHLMKAGIKLWLLCEENTCAAIRLAAKCKVTQTTVSNLADCQSQAEFESCLEDARSSQFNSKHRQLNFDDVTYGEIQKFHSMDNARASRARKKTFFQIAGNEQTSKPLDVQDQIQPFSVVIDQAGLEFALAHPDTHNQLLGFLQEAHSVVFTGLSAADKGMLMQTLNAAFQSRLTTLGVVKTESDGLVLPEVSVGIAISGSVLKPMTEVTIPVVSHLKSFILSDGKRIAVRMSRLALLIFFRGVLSTVLRVLLALEGYDGIYMSHMFSTLLWLPAYMHIGLADGKFSSTVKPANQPMQAMGLSILSFRLIAVRGCVAIVLGCVLWGICRGLGEYVYAASDAKLPSDLVPVIVTAGEALCLLEAGLSQSRKGLQTALAIAFTGTVLFTILSGFGYVATANLGPFLLVVCGGVLSCTCIRIAGNILSQHLPQITHSSQKLQRLSNGHLKRHTGALVNSKSTEFHSIHTYTLKFIDPLMEARYASAFFRSKLALLRSTYIGLGLWELFVGCYGAFSGVSMLLIVIVLLSGLFSTGCGLCMSFRPLHKHFRVLSVIPLFNMLLYAALAHLLCEIEGKIFTVFLPIVTFLVLDPDWVSMVILNVIHFFVSCLFITQQGINKDSIDTFIYYAQLIVFLAGIILTCGFIGYYYEKHKRQQFALVQETTKVLTRNNAILKSLLPAFVIDRVKQGQRSISEEKGEVSVLFCDISNFDELCSQLSPENLVHFLDTLFYSFDLLCAREGVAKIETVGKTYMASAGIPDYEATLSVHNRRHSHAARAVNLGLAMIQHARDIRLPNGSLLQLKVGINTGPVTIGVVGLHKPQFSLVGDTVNTASRMCSTLQSTGQVQISAATRSAVKDELDCFYTELSVYAKGKGIITTYLVLRADAVTASEPGLIGKFSSSEADNKGDETLTLDLTAGIDEWSDLHSAYWAYSVSNDARMLKAIQLVGIGIFGLLLVLLLSDLFEEIDSDELISIVSRSFQFISSIIIFYIFKRAKSPRVFTGLMLLATTLNTVCCLVEEAFIPPDLQLLQQFYLMLLIYYAIKLNLVYTLPASLLTLVGFIVVDVVVDSFSWFQLQKIGIVVVLIVLCALSVRAKERQMRRQFCLHQLNDRENITAKQLLHNLMPAWVLAELHADLDITDQLDDVTLLFADIVGFTAYSAEHSPSEVIEMLSRLFTEFDQLCVEYSVYKLYTIGDCFVILGCVDKDLRNPVTECLNVLDVAFRMTQVIQKNNIDHQTELDMRIGLHTGKIIGGITGTQIVRYDVYGADVALANKMESTGTPGRIKVSDVTKRLIERGRPTVYDFEFDGVIELKAAARAHPSYYISP